MAPRSENAIGMPRRSERIFLKDSKPLYVVEKTIEKSKSITIRTKRVQTSHDVYEVVKKDEDEEAENLGKNLVKSTIDIYNQHLLICTREEAIRCASQSTGGKRKKSRPGLKAPKKMRSSNEVLSSEKNIRCVSQSTGGKRKKSRPDLKALTKKRSSNEVQSSEKNIRCVSQSTGGKGKKSRPDLKALTKMRSNNEALYWKNQIIGKIPGINCGDQFFSRSEMAAVGLHKFWLNGIDYIGIDDKKPVDGLGFIYPLATAIVNSGGYADNEDNGDEITYSGQGGNNLVSDKQQFKDQDEKNPATGNLAMKNAMLCQTPVRVMRIHKCNNIAYYTYDGLYQVVEHWFGKGKSKHNVLKFKLKRIEVNQPALEDYEQVQFKGSKTISKKEYRNGYEDINKMFFSKDIEQPNIFPPGCNCKGGICSEKTCGCAKLNGGNFPYLRGGRLIEPKSVVFECGPKCGCGSQCINRATQKLPKYDLEVFDTKKMGWGVRSKNIIPAGAPVCEYIGEVKTTKDLDELVDCTYSFALDCAQTIKGVGGRECRLTHVTLPSYIEDAIKKESDDAQFGIDAFKKGNISRFINHSCEPNLYVQSVLSDHHDVRFARIVFIAGRTIRSKEELSYDYGYETGSVRDKYGNMQQLKCVCGAEKCRKILY